MRVRRAGRSVSHETGLGPETAIGLTMNCQSGTWSRLRIRPFLNVTMPVNDTGVIEVDNFGPRLDRTAKQWKTPRTAGTARDIKRVLPGIALVHDHIQSELTARSSCCSNKLACLICSVVIWPTEKGLSRRLNALKNLGLFAFVGRSRLGSE